MSGQKNTRRARGDRHGPGAPPLPLAEEQALLVQLERRVVTFAVGGVQCPDCGHIHEGERTPGPGLQRCDACGRRYVVKIGLDDMPRAYQLVVCCHCGQVVGFDLFGRTGYHEKERKVPCPSVGKHGMQQLPDPS